MEPIYKAGEDAQIRGGGTPSCPNAARSTGTQVLSKACRTPALRRVTLGACTHTPSECRTCNWPPDSLSKSKPSTTCYCLFRAKHCAPFQPGCSLCPHTAQALSCPCSALFLQHLPQISTLAPSFQAGLRCHIHALLEWLTSKMLHGEACGPLLRTTGQSGPTRAKALQRQACS